MTSHDVHLSLGPLLYNWTPEQTRDFYFQVADEMPVEQVFIGEVVCIKRCSLSMQYFPAIVKRLKRAGKQVVFSSLALVATDQEFQDMLTEFKQHHVIEMNDLAFIDNMPQHFMIGPYVNIYNESTLAFFEQLGVMLVTLPFELPRNTIKQLASVAKTALAVQVFGRAGLAISVRCYHARAFHLHKNSCMFVCGKDPNGMEVKTLDDTAFLVINGTQTQSHTCINLLAELHDLKSIGIRHFRLSPQSTQMICIANIFHHVLHEKLSVEEGLVQLNQIVHDMPYANGFYHGLPGNQFKSAYHE